MSKVRFWMLATGCERGAAAPYITAFVPGTCSDGSKPICCTQSLPGQVAYRRVTECLLGTFEDQFALHREQASIELQANAPSAP